MSLGSGMTVVTYRPFDRLVIEAQMVRIISSTSLRLVVGGY